MKVSYVLGLCLILVSRMVFADAVRQDSYIAFPSLNKQPNHQEDVLAIYGAVNHQAIEPLFRAYQE